MIDVAGVRKALDAGANPDKIWTTREVKRMLAQDRELWPHAWDGVQPGGQTDYDKSTIVYYYAYLIGSCVG